MKVIPSEFHNKEDAFYKKILQIIEAHQLPVLVAGTHAVKYYTGITRHSKDLDLFCTASSYPNILKVLQQNNCTVEIVDERWLAKITHGEAYLDLIFGSTPGIWRIDDNWIHRAPEAKLLQTKIKVTPLEELILSKAYRMNRKDFDGPDIAHLFLKQHQQLDWNHLWLLFEPNWEILLMHIIHFRFIYPSKRDLIPKEIMQRLITNLQNQIDLPSPEDHLTRGSLLSVMDYRQDIEQWGYLDITEWKSHKTT